MAETKKVRVLICIGLFEAIQKFFDVNFSRITIYSLKEYRKVSVQLKNDQPRCRKNI